MKKRNGVLSFFLEKIPFGVGVIILLWVPGLIAQGPDTLWTRTYGGADTDFGFSVQETSEGGYVITGYTFSFGSGWRDIYVLRTDTNGDSLWTRTYGGTDWDSGFSVKQTLDGGFIITGSTASSGAGGDDVYLIKTDQMGNLRWEETYGGPNNDFGWSVEQTSDGGYIVAGFISHGGLLDVYLIKTKADPTSCGEQESLRESFFISEAKPNSFTGQTLILYRSPFSTKVSLKIYDLSGRLVRTLFNGRTKRGYHALFWDGRSDSGEEISPGVYFLRLDQGDYISTRKLLVMR